MQRYPQPATAGQPRRSGRLRRLCLPALFLGAVAAAPAPAPRDEGPQVVMFFGDSLSSGYGVETEHAFPALLQARLDSLGAPVRIVNAGLAGDTSAAGRRRVAWLLREPVDVFVLELGGNDGLRGLPLEQTERNLQAILDTVTARCPAAILVVAGVRLPPNLGPHYTDAFQAMFPRLAAANEALLIPRLLEGVAGHRELMSGDGIHPNVEGHRRVAETVWQALAPVLRLEGGSAGAAQDLEGGDGTHSATAGDTEGDGQ